MTLEKLTIEYEQGQEGKFTGTTRALFNPSELTFSRKLTWTPKNTALARTPVGVSFDTRQLATLTVALFLDTYEGAPTGGLFGTSLGASSKPTSVLPYVAAITSLASMQPSAAGQRALDRPPTCVLRWGQQVLFMGVLTSVDHKLVLFLEDGTPVRATMTCSFLEYVYESAAAAADTATKYTVQQGDSLQSIAAAQYDDDSQWRVIAAANGIDDPRKPLSGLTLLIPKLL
jgi:contractile injection system tube protein/LysM domain-containing protein